MSKKSAKPQTPHVKGWIHSLFKEEEKEQKNEAHFQTGGAIFKHLWIR